MLFRHAYSNVSITDTKLRDMTDEEFDALPFDEDAWEVKLKARTEVFIQEYLVDLNVSKAAMRAGLAPQTGQALTKDPIVATRIRTAIEQRCVRTKMTQDVVLQEMSLIALSRVNHYNIDEMGNLELSATAPEGAMAAVQSIKRKVSTRTDKEGGVTTEVNVELKLWDKNTPLRLMGRHVGLFPDRMEHTGPNGGPIETVTKIERQVIDAPAQAEV